LNVNKIKEDFPIFKRFSKEGIVYLDNAATTQKPYAVINAVKDFTENHNANVHRGVYRLGEEATELYNEAREKVSRLIGANPNNIIFVRNATEALNLGANGLVSMMKPGGDILISRMEHHSNIVPWQLLREKNNFHIRYIRNEQDQIIDWKTVEENLTDRTEIVSLTQCSNLLGNINDLKDVGKHLHNLGIKFMVDAAQSVPHMPVNAKDLNCDLLAFSGHKMLGPTGIGCLFGTDEFLKRCHPSLEVEK
jgi:Selenocysteine lyase